MPEIWQNMARKTIRIEQYIGGWGYNKEMLRLDLEGTQEDGALLEIASLGGSLFDALNMYTQISQHGNVEVIFTGPSASAATVLAMGARKISVVENGFLLIHKVMSMVDNYGTFNEDDLDKLIQDLQLLRTENQKFDLAIARIYSKRSGKSIEETIETMKTGSWMSAAEAKKMGIVDDIIDPQVRWNYNTERFVAMVSGNHLPELPETHMQNQNNTDMKQFENLNRLLEVDELQASDEGCYLNEEQLSQVESQLMSISNITEKCNASLLEAEKRCDEANLQRDALQKELDSKTSDFDALQLHGSELEAQVTDLTNQNRALQDSLTAAESQNTETFHSIDVIDESVAAATTLEEKVAAIKLLLSNAPGAPAPGTLREVDPHHKTGGVNWDVINKLPHNREADNL